jgi:hypothetical protein
MKYLLALLILLVAGTAHAQLSTGASNTIESSLGRGVEREISRGLSLTLAPSVIAGNDTVRVQAAIDRLLALGGGTLRILPGAYVVQNVTLYPEVILQPAGGVPRSGTASVRFSLPSTTDTAVDQCFTVSDNLTLADVVDGQMLVNSSIVSPAAFAKRRDLLINSPPQNVNRNIYHWRHYAPSGATYLGRDDFYVPFGGNLYAQYSFNQFTSTTVRTFGITNECRAGLFTAAASATSTTGSWTDLTDVTAFIPGTPDTGGGNIKNASTNTASMTFSGATMTGNALALIIFATTSNGYAIVEVDGDQTGSSAGANLLPKVTASMIVSAGGNYLDTDLGKTYIDFYAGSPIGDEHVGIAEGLDEDQAHSMVIYVRGTKGTTASSGTSVRIVGAVACRRDSLPTTANHRMVRMRKINDLHLSLSACTAVIGWDSTTTSSAARLCGENHVGTDGGVLMAEGAVSYTLVDAAGSTVTPSVGAYATSTAFTISRVTTLTKAGVDFATKTVTYRFRSDTPLQLTATGRINFITNGYVHTALIGMLPCFQMRDRYSTTSEKTQFDRGLVGDRLIPNLNWVSGGSLEYKVRGVDTMTVFSTEHDTVYLMHCPNIATSLNNTKYSYPDESYMRAVANVVGAGAAPGGLKAYFGRVGQSSLGGTVEPAPAGTVYDFEVGWRVMRIQRAAEVLQLRP